MEIKRVGLVLGGGGVKGAYQFGAMLALQKHGILKKVCAASASSIGAVNLLLLLSGNIKEGIDLWKHIGRDEFLPRRKIREIITGIRNFGIFERTGLINLLEQTIDFEKVSSNPIKSFVCAAQKNRKDVTYFQLNNVGKENIISYILASSAIPYIYQPVKIDDVKYIDGGFVENEPFEPLRNEGIDLFIVIPLNDNYVIPEWVFAKAPVIDLGNEIFKGLKKREGINFDSMVSQRRMEIGYRQTDKLINNLKKEGMLLKSNDAKGAFSHYKIQE